MVFVIFTDAPTAGSPVEYITRPFKLICAWASTTKTNCSETSKRSLRRNRFSGRTLSIFETIRIELLDDFGDEEENMGPLPFLMIDSTRGQIDPMGAISGSG